jgi:hypothetical protein
VSLSDAVIASAARLPIGCSARPIGLKAGLPIETPGLKLNMDCATG